MKSIDVVYFRFFSLEIILPLIHPNFPRCLPGLWRSYPRATNDGTTFSAQAIDDLIVWFSYLRKAVCPYFPSSIHVPPVDFTWPSISPGYARADLRRRSSIRFRVFRNSSFGTANPANWKVTYRPWLTILAPILISFSRSVVRDQCSISFGKANVRMKLA